MSLKGDWFQIVKHVINIWFQIVKHVIKIWFQVELYAFQHASERKKK